MGSTATPASLPLFAEIRRTKYVGQFTYTIQKNQEEGCTLRSPILVRGDTWPLVPGREILLADATITPDPSGVSYYCIIMESKNGSFREFLGVRSSNEKSRWQFSYGILDAQNIVVATQQWSR